VLTFTRTAGAEKMSEMMSKDAERGPGGKAKQVCLFFQVGLIEI
jgi:hypothetical protein